MTVIINPGSRIGETSAGWTNTRETAQAEAERWLARMHDEGMTDVELLPEVSDEHEGRWTFTYRHRVTGARSTLETHGIDNRDAYCKVYWFTPKAYWNGSSCSNPELENFAAEGYEAVRTFRRIDAGAEPSDA